MGGKDDWSLHMGAAPCPWAKLQSVIAQCEPALPLICCLKGQNRLLRKTFPLASPWRLNSQNQLAQISAQFGLYIATG